ncbi:MAG: alpha/beta hydrolase [Candidatus Kaiserbacteria bacterium]|nr:alpha/beta hydrolase [Candidatus Kaiserbacteria bacterium]
MSMEGKMDRRNFLKGAAAIGAAALLPDVTVSDMQEKLEAARVPTALEKRFGSRMEFDGNATDIIDIQPEQPSDKPDILVAPGFNASIHTNAPVLEMLAKDGRRVMSLNHPHAGRSLRESADSKESRAKFPLTELRKASNLLDLIDAKSPEKPVDCFAFSEGALNTMLAAYLHPEKFNSIILSAPAGLIGDDSLITLAGLQNKESGGLMQRFSAQSESDNAAARLPAYSSDEALRQEEMEMFKHIASTWEADEETAKKHLVATIEDLWALSHMRIDDMVAFVRAAGVKVAVISGVEDKVFPTERMARRLPKDSLDGFMATQGAHGPHYSARAITYIFGLLDAKREKEREERAAAKQNQ